MRWNFRRLCAAGLGLALTIGLTMAASVPAQAESNGGVRVMPLGDSITDGFNVPGGYRINLWQRLAAGGYTVDFVGSGFNGPAGLGDHDHEGHSGWRIDQIDANIVGWLQTHRPAHHPAAHRHQRHEPELRRRQRAGPAVRAHRQDPGQRADGRAVRRADHPGSRPDAGVAGAGVQRRRPRHRGAEGAADPPGRHALRRSPPPTWPTACTRTRPATTRWRPAGSPRCSPCPAASPRPFRRSAPRSRCPTRSRTAASTSPAPAPPPAPRCTSGTATAAPTSAGPAPPPVNCASTATAASTSTATAPPTARRSRSGRATARPPSGSPSTPNGTIVGAGSGKCVDVTASGTANGTLVQLWTCNGTGAQRWSVR